MKLSSFYTTRWKIVNIEDLNTCLHFKNSCLWIGASVTPPQSHVSPMHILDAWDIKTTPASRSSLPRTCKVWNGPLDVFSLCYNMGIFKQWVNRVLKGRQRICCSFGVADVYDQHWPLPINRLSACLKNYLFEQSLRFSTIYEIRQTQG